MLLKGFTELLHLHPTRDLSKDLYSVVLLVFGVEFLFFLFKRSCRVFPQLLQVVLKFLFEGSQSQQDECYSLSYANFGDISISFLLEADNL